MVGDDVDDIRFDEIVTDTTDKALGSAVSEKLRRALRPMFQTGLGLIDLEIAEEINASL